MRSTIRDIKKRTEKLLAPFNHFFKSTSAGGAVLLLFAVLAMILANTEADKIYEDILQLHFSIAFLDMSVLHWINDGLMAVFFFVIGLEIKREFLFGELKSLSATILPIAAAMGGMIVPALIYFLFNFGQPTLSGWGIPMSTDIAFSLGILSMAAGNAPRSIAVFLTALAIVDDLGAIIVIALFYSGDISFVSLGCGLAALAAAFLFNRSGVRQMPVYICMGLIAWVSFYQAGIHPTIAGVILGLTIPADENREGQSLLSRMEHKAAPWSSWLVMPVFALANAGVDLHSLGWEELLSPVAAGVIAGLFIGKPLGIFGVAFLLFRLKIIKIPENTACRHFLGAGFLGGIGFTMSLFVASLAFSAAADHLTEAKAGIIMASCLSGLAGMLIFKMISGKE